MNGQPGRSDIASAGRDNAIAPSGRDNLIANVRTQARGCRDGGSPFYADLFDRVARDIAVGGTWWQLLAPFAAEAFETCRPLRLAGALHRRVLSGMDHALADVWERSLTDAWPVIEHTLQSNPQFFAEALARPVQTNEVGRSVAIVGGLLLLAHELQLPVALREIGASGGLNLRVDRYWYEQGSLGWGNPGSTVRFVDQYTGTTPPLDAGLEIADRKGCDLYPVDITTAEGRATLLGFVWPGQTERLAALRDAIDEARAVAAPIERSDAVDFVATCALEQRAGRLMVLYHSIVWWYLSPAARSALTAAIERVGASATAAAPFAWLRFEPPATATVPVELRLTLWPGGHERLLAVGGFHRNPVEWKASPQQRVQRLGM